MTTCCGAEVFFDICLLCPCSRMQRRTAECEQELEIEQVDDETYADDGIWTGRRGNVERIKQESYPDACVCISFAGSVLRRLRPGWGRRRRRKRQRSWPSPERLKGHCCGRLLGSSAPRTPKCDPFLNSSDSSMDRQRKRHGEPGGAGAPVSTQIIPDRIVASRLGDKVKLIPDGVD